MNDFYMIVRDGYKKTAKSMIAFSRGLVQSTFKMYLVPCNDLPVTEPTCYQCYNQWPAGKNE